MSSWTNVSKPSDSTYVKISPQGQETYDESTITFDDPNVFYDGVNALAWTDVSKPTGESQSSTLVGIATGLFMPLTKSSVMSVVESQWTKVNKPN